MKPQGKATYVVPQVARQFSAPVTIRDVTAIPILSETGTSPNMVLGQMHRRPALLIKLTDGHGCSGWGEIWANFPTRANIHKAHLIEDVVAAALTGLSFTDPREVEQALRQKLAIFFLHAGQSRVLEHIIAGIDIAAWDLCLRSRGESFASFMGLNATPVRSYASSINAPDLEMMLSRHLGWGQEHFKLKVGFDEGQDCAFVERAIGLLPKNARLMIDSNQSWEVEQAKRLLQRMEHLEILFAEEPIAADAGGDQWEALAKSTVIPLAAGENTYGVADFLAMADAGVKYLQPDVAKWGGISGALDLAKRLPRGVFLWPHFMGTAIGQIAALSVSAVLGEQSVCEMDVNSNPMRTDLCGDILGVRKGRVSLPDAPGLVVPPLPETLRKLAGRIKTG